MNDDERMEPEEEIAPWQIRNEGQNGQLGTSLTEVGKEVITKCLTKNHDLFADMSEINPCIISHQLSMCIECEEAFSTLKTSLSSPPIPTKQVIGQSLLVYLRVSPEAVSASLIQGMVEQKPINFVSRVLQDVETKYKGIEKVALALVHASQRL